MIPKTEVTVLVTTCDRYDTTLPLCLMSIINQTYKPNRVVLVDDNKEKKFYEYEILRNILLLCKHKEIKFDYYQGPSKGCVYALDLGLSKIKSGWVMKVDDDNVLNPDVLEIYVNNISENVGAIGGLILDSKSHLVEEHEQDVYNKVSQIFSKWNIQMIKNQSDKIKPVEHIYSNYFFNMELGIKQTLELAPSCHREDTMFTHQIFRKGYDLIIIPQSVTYHLNYDDNTGDNRYSKENFNKNEFFFIEKLKEWDIVPKEIEIIELQDRYVTTVAEIGGEQAYIVMEK